ncbi:MAG: MFS transporter, partial [Actinobacteria bacterium]|nr:MFS transporter [Actinomycetota bacterium]
SEVAIVALILVLSRRIKDTASRSAATLDVVGAALSAAGLGIAVFGVLKSSVWGWLAPPPNGPSLFGASLTFWFVVVGLLLLWCFLLWEKHLITVGREPLVRMSMLRNTVLRSGLTLFGFQFMIQAGVFFVVPLYLSVVLELPALETGLRVLPLSLSLLVAALGIPRLWPHLSPRLAVRLGIALMLIGILLLRSGISIDAAAAVVALPMVFMGLGIGTLASQLGALVVSSVDESLSGDVGGLQNTATNLGSSLGTAVAGSILIAALTSSFLTGITQNQDVPESVKAQANVSLSDGAPFLSDADLTAGLVKAGADPQLQSAILAQNRTSRIAGLHAALGVLSLIAVLALFFTGGIPTRQPGVRPPGEPGPDGDEPDGEVPGDGRPDDEVPGDERPDDERPGDQRAGDRRAADPASGPTGRQSPTASAASSPAP